MATISTANMTKLLNALVDSTDEGKAPKTIRTELVSAAIKAHRKYGYTKKWREIVSSAPEGIFPETDVLNFKLIPEGKLSNKQQEELLRLKLPKKLAIGLAPVLLIVADKYIPRDRKKAEPVVLPFSAYANLCELYKKHAEAERKAIKIRRKMQSVLSSVRTEKQLKKELPEIYEVYTTKVMNIVYPASSSEKQSGKKKKK